ncbi:PEP-utilizing enzyme [Actinoplanes sp. NPDC051859]|uniref:PEP-utilizing enzyme n=1 Tax=Actinoplanes sp. NPDC051859 TaxID=3363909 RepID=UPI0037B31564
MLVIALTESCADRTDLVGGKAAGLGRLIRRGERVPAGFCITTEAYRGGIVPEAEIAEAYAQLGDGPVAVRSSATAEDLPDASFAGQRGALPDLGLADFLRAYGHRGVAEVDLGVPRWDENLEPVFAMLANLLRGTDPDQAPDRRFARAAATAEATLRDLSVRARRRPVRGRIAIFLLGRARALAGLREAGKFAGLYRLRAMRHHLLFIGAELAAAGRLDQPGDIMFLTLDEAREAVHDGADQRGTAAARKAVHQAESRRRAVPVGLLSDGTDIETVLPARPHTGGTLTGVGAAAGRVTGPARIVHDPTTARVEPGEILVATTTDPGWTPLFLTAGGLVTETGAIMAHGPTVAREYGIPAVISVPGATRRIRTGQLITVDGAAGIVTIDPGPPDPLTGPAADRLTEPAAEL